MSEVVAQVTEIVPRTGVSKKTGKPYTAYTVRATGRDGQGLSIGWGFNAPSFAPGDWIKTVVEVNGQYLNYKGAPVETRQGELTQTQQTVAAGPSAAPGTDRQHSIVYQSSRKDAIAFVLGLLQFDAVPISSAGGKAGQAKRFEQSLELVRKVTVEFFHDVETLRLLDTVADGGDIDLSTARGELPEEDVVEDDDDEDPFA